MSIEVGPERIGEVLDAYRHAVRPIHERASGLEAHVVLADRDAGRLLFIGIWESERAVADVAAELEPARKRLWDAFGRSPELVRYEVIDQIRVSDSLS